MRNSLDILMAALNAVLLWAVEEDDYIKSGHVN